MKIRRPFRAVVYVAVIVAALGYVVLSASQLPAFRDGTVVGTATAGLFGKARQTGMHFPELFATQTNGQWKVVRQNELDPADWTDASRRAISLWMLNSKHRWGMWHCIIETHQDKVRLWELVGMRPINDRLSRQEILAGIDQAIPGSYISGKVGYYASGGGSTRRILWLGVLGDLSILAAFAAIIFSLVKLRREIRWRKPGHCAKCDYDLAGLTTNQCPECGAAVNPSKSI